MEGKLTIEIVLRKNASNYATVEKFLPVIKDYIIIENAEKIIVNIGEASEWFKNDTIMQMFRELDESVYVALAYITTRDEMVLDFNGKRIDAYEVVKDNIIHRKYVKKKLVIVHNDESVLDVKAYVVDPKFTNPVVKVLDVYLMKSEGSSMLKYITEEFAE